MAWEIKFIKFLQFFNSSFVSGFYKTMTSLGEVYFFLIFLSISWIVASRKFSTHFTFLLLFTVLTNTILKEIFMRPRPFILHPELQLFPAEGFAFPSGHSQIAVVFWGFLAYNVKKKYFSYLCSFLIISIGFSRIYLGVHYPTDVVCGWSIGAICLVFYHKSHLFWSRYQQQSSLMCLCAAIVSIQLFHTELLIPTLGALCGVIIGQYLATTSNIQQFELRGNHIVRAFVSIVGTLLIYICGKKLLPKTDIIRFLNYICILIWMSFLAPWLFSKKISRV